MSGVLQQDGGFLDLTDEWYSVENGGFLRLPLCKQKFIVFF